MEASELRQFLLNKKSDLIDEFITDVVKEEFVDLINAGYDPLTQFVDICPTKEFIRQIGTEQLVESLKEKGYQASYRYEDQQLGQTYVLTIGLGE